MAGNRDEHRGTAREDGAGDGADGGTGGGAELDAEDAAGALGWEELAPGVLRCRLPGWDATVGAVRGASGVLVVDTGSSAGEGARIREGLRGLFGLPVTHVALTHDHFDHVFGTAAFDGAEMYGAEGLGAHLAGARGELRRDAVRHGMDAATAAESAALLVPPRHGVRGRCALTPGAGAGSGTRADAGADVRLVAMGAAHSGFDLAVVVTAPAGSGGAEGGTGTGRRVVFCGDLVEESGEPQAGPDAEPSRWPAALDRLLALGGEDARYVPGHGAVVGADFVRAQRDVLARRFARS
ncbi:glyoxylase-like metal-dependent hydrolase (beta-lactamase superfamily II) [Streptomyces sp. Amel2xB2]|uniref:MBL fold metallo-hydrolase n=1 Tax=Streptomyces sp. Amel2xB2 TaxID=1305829 RepID=UPI000DB9F655|nr:MBL fold metallo-hydrolase [Streptomyces sp. Amel2xB2]RAJ70034.1 glyoxylase-like metal-dependent hydrolase (beta-lactamase superfamily II) [Streptomyces sp. Amel2xB2]